MREVVRALIAMADRRIAGVVNIGSGRPHTLAAVAAVVADVVGHTGITTEAGHPDEVDSTWADTTRCNRLLGFRPATDVRAVVVRQLAAQAALVTS